MCKILQNWIVENEAIVELDEKENNSIRVKRSGLLRSPKLDSGE